MPDSHARLDSHNPLAASALAPPKARSNRAQYHRRFLGHPESPIMALGAKRHPQVTRLHVTHSQTRNIVPTSRIISSSVPSSAPSPIGTRGDKPMSHNRTRPRVAPSSPTSRYARNASIVLIGMRGVGKRSLASVTAKALGWEALFADQIFVELAKQDILSYVNAHGWDDFRLKEAQIIQALLTRYPTNKVIACGGGVVEREDSRRLLKAFGQTKGPVIHVMREQENVLSFLEENSKLYPEYNNRSTALERWDIREQYYRECASHEFVSLSVPMPSVISAADSQASASELTSLALKPVETAFLRLLRFIVGTDTNHIPVGPTAPRSFFLSLTFDEMAKAVPIIDDISTGIDCWEIRVDWLKSVDPTFVAFQVALLRRYSDLPILFTTRTRSQGGKYPDLDDVETQKKMYELVMQAYRLGIEYVDLELSWPEHMLVALIANRSNTKVIGSWHDTTGSITWTGRETREIYEKGARLGVDIIEIINTARITEDNITLRAFVDQVAARGIPLVAFNMGPEGKLSRIQNTILTAVSHPLLPSVAAPGQISYAETQSALYLIGSLPAQSFYLFGTPIAHSLSPVLHRSAFAALNLPHTFTPVSAGLGEQDLSRLREITSRPDFGGAAVTNPLKIAAMGLCRRVSHHARVIGAINSLMPIQTPGPPSPPRIPPPIDPPRGGSALGHGNGSGGGGYGLYGENTDWRGIKTCIARCINPANAVTSSTTALVIGAGGSSRAAIYALHQLGVANIIVWNRTREKAKALVDELGRRLQDPELGGAPFLRLGVLEGGLDAESIRRALSPLPPPSIIISTIPASVLTNGSSSSTPTAGLEERVGVIPDVGLRRDVLDLSPAGGVAVELAYQPRKTPLLALVDQVNASPASLRRSRSPNTPNSGSSGSSGSASSAPNANNVNPASAASSGGSASGSGRHASFSSGGGRGAAIPGGPDASTKAGPWVGIEGCEILLEQGYEQIRLWTSRRAPQARVRSEVMKEFERHVQQRLA